MPLVRPPMRACSPAPVKLPSRRLGSCSLPGVEDVGTWFPGTSRVRCFFIAWVLCCKASKRIPGNLRAARAPRSPRAEGPHEQHENHRSDQGNKQRAETAEPVGEECEHGAVSWAIAVPRCL